MAGSILVAEGAQLPSAQLLPRESSSNGWAMVTGLPSAFEKAIEAAGWTFFFMAGVIKASVFGFDRQKTLRSALRRLTVNAESQRCNSIEILRVVSKSFLGVPYVSVSAHPRHLQKGRTFQGHQ